ncbi:MAG TPA: hypothetical protein VFY17_04470 [Pilimelia sp.]|nr:hypothetical protein [Pilimelia sp.]
MVSDSLVSPGMRPLLFWAGVAGAPVSALMILFADSGTAIRVAALVALVAVVLVGLSTMARGDVASPEALEDAIFDESDALREDLREDIKTAVRAVHKSLVEKHHGAADEIEVLRAHVARLESALLAPRPVRAAPPRQLESAPVAAAPEAVAHPVIEQRDGDWQYAAPVPLDMQRPGPRDLVNARVWVGQAAVRHSAARHGPDLRPASGDSARHAAGDVRPADIHQVDGYRPPAPLADGHAHHGGGPGAVGGAYGADGGYANGHGYAGRSRDDRRGSAAPQARQPGDGRARHHAAPDYAAPDHTVSDYAAADYAAVTDHAADLAVTDYAVTDYAVTDYAPGDDAVSYRDAAHHGSHATGRGDVRDGYGDVRDGYGDAGAPHRDTDVASAGGLYDGGRYGAGFRPDATGAPGDATDAYPAVADLHWSVDAPTGWGEAAPPQRWSPERPEPPGVGHPAERYAAHSRYAGQARAAEARAVDGSGRAGPGGHLSLPAGGFAAEARTARQRPDDVW